MAWIGGAIALASSPIGQALQGAIIGAVKRGTTEVLARPDVPIEDKDVAATAQKTTVAITPAIVNQVLATLTNDRVIGPALNQEPLTSSGNFWLGVVGVLSSAGGLITLALVQHSYDYTSYLPLLTTLGASVGIIWRRVHTGNALAAKVTPVGGT